jgi:hypothetical protein
MIPQHIGKNITERQEIKEFDYKCCPLTLCLLLYILMTLSALNVTFFNSRFASKIPICILSRFRAADWIFQQSCEILL